MNHRENIGTISWILLFVVCGAFLFSGTLLNFTFNTEHVEQYVFKYINEERANRGLPVLGHDSQLELISKSWSNHMVETGVLEHGDFQGRLQTIGYAEGHRCGEIIENYSSPMLFSLDLEMYSNAPSAVAKELVVGWLNSPAHREVMLTAQNGDMGVAVSRRGFVTYFGVVDFRFY